MPENIALFVYGTLQSPRVLRAVLGYLPHSRLPATLAGYACRRMQGRSYPAIFPSPQETVQGLLIQGLHLRDIERLDAFESIEYERLSVSPTLAHGETLEAFAYVLAPGRLSAVSDHPWKLEDLSEAAIEDLIREL